MAAPNKVDPLRALPTINRKDVRLACLLTADPEEGSFMAFDISDARGRG